MLASLRALALAATLVVAPTAVAEKVDFKAVLDGASVRPTGSLTIASGVGLFSFDTLAQTWDLTLAAGGWSGTASGARISGLAGTAGTAPLLFDLYTDRADGSAGSMTNVDSFLSIITYGQSFIARPNASVSQQIAGLFNSQLYLTVVASGAEIRGQLVPTVGPVPEPEVYAMMLIGLTLLGVRLRGR